VPIRLRTIRKYGKVWRVIKDGRLVDPEQLKEYASGEAIAIGRGWPPGERQPRAESRMERLGCFYAIYWMPRPKKDHGTVWADIAWQPNRIGPHQYGQFPQVAYGRLSTVIISAFGNCIIGL